MRLSFNQVSLIWICLSLFSLSLHSQQAAPTPVDTPHKTCGMHGMMDLYPELAEEAAEYIHHAIPQLEEQGRLNQLSAAPILTIPVVVHVIHNGENIGTGANLSVEQIEAQLEILNQDFLATNSNFGESPSQWTAVLGNPEIQFCLANVDDNGFASTGITRHNIEVTGTTINNSNIDSSIKPATFWDPTKYYNIWTLSIPGTNAQGGVVGYAYLPTTGIINDNRDGTVVDWNWFGGPGFGQSGYKTLTHETGHYLGLPHTFNGDACNDDDNISDTPNIDEATSSKIPNLTCSGSNFPTGPSSCSNEAMYINYMDYVNSDYCYTSFTFGQVAVMRGVLNGNSNISGFGSRQSLTTSSATACNFEENDAGIVQITNPSAGLVCNLDAITPQVTLSNFGATTLTSVKIMYQINAQTPVEFIWEDNLETGESVAVSLATYTPPTGSYTFKAYTELPNGASDGQTSNDLLSIETASVLPTNLPLTENFEDSDFDPTDNGLFIYNPTSDDFEWQRSTTVSAYGNGNGCAVFNNYDGANSNNPFGTYDALITPIYDFSSVTEASLTFDVAYVRYGDGGQFFTDSLLVLVSTDCGTTYNQQIFLEGGATLETGTATNQEFVPSATDWKTIDINLSQFDNLANVSFSFINLSGWGNILYLDNIAVSQAQTCELFIDASIIPQTCADECDASIVLGIIGGSGGPTYQWDASAGSQTSGTATNLCAGSYSVTVTDGNGCSATETFTIDPTPALTLGVTSTDETIAGANDGTATATSDGAAPGSTFVWNTGATTATITDLSPSTYSVTMTDPSGCQANGATTVNAGSVDCSSLSISFTHTDATCNGGNDGTATPTIITNFVGGMYSYLWSNGSINFVGTDLAIGTYTLMVTEHITNCTVVGEVTIGGPTPILQTVLGTNETSAGANDGTATVYATGGTPDYTYLWSNNGTTQTLTGLSPGEYFVTITDANGCIEIGQTMINSASADCSAISVQSSGINASCNGMSDGTVVGIAIGGTPPFNYFWSNGQEGSINSGVPAGTYSVTVSDANSCIAIGQTMITEPSLLVTNISSTDETTAGANDGTASVSVNGGTADYSYFWNTGASTANINSLSPGIYSVTTTDKNGCSSIENTTVGAGNVDCTSFEATVVTTNISCNGLGNGSASALVSGGIESYTYQWNNGATTSSVSDLGTGLILVTVTDNNGCSFIAENIIQQPTALATTSTTMDASSPNMADGSATISVTGGTPSYSYLWPTEANTPMVNNLEAGTYPVTVTDANNCQAVETVVIGNAMVDCLSFTASLSESNPSCHGMNDGQIIANTNGGTEPFTYSWSNGATTAINSDLSAGVYTLLIRDANNCELEQSGTITEPTLIVSNLSTETGVCGQTGLAMANPSGGLAPYFYKWNTGQTTQNIDVTTTAVYEVTITDIMGCSIIDEVEVQVHAADLGVDFDPIAVSCFGESDGGIDLTVTGGMPPYQYEWNTGATTENLMNIPGGDYSVLVTDNNGCTFLKTIALSGPSLLEIACTVTPESSGNDGTASATAVGGTAPFIYFWSNGQSGSSVDNLTAGAYLVTVTDANGCQEQCLVDVMATTSTEVIQSLTNLEIYPNPTDRYLNVKASFSQPENIKIQVLNIVGQEVYRTIASGQALDINMDLENLPTGTYMLLLQTEKGQVVRKVVVN